MRIILVKNGIEEEIEINENISSFLNTKLNDNYFIISEDKVYDYIKNEKKETLRLDVYIPKNIDNLSIPLVQNIIKEKEKNNYEIQEIHNIREHDYDIYELNNPKYLSILNKIYQNENYFMDNEEIFKLKEKGEKIDDLVKEELSISKNFLLYIKEKQNNLNPFEKVLFKYYREFDLENLLTTDEEINFSINNHNSGSITIFEDKIKKSNLTKRYHSDEFKYHFKESGYDTYLFKDAFINGNQPIMDKYKVCFVRIASEYVIIDTPESINEYQKMEILKLIDEIKFIKETKRSDIKLYYLPMFVDGRMHASIEETIEYINNLGKKK